MQGEKDRERERARATKRETRAGFVTKVHACPPPPPRLHIPAATPLWGQMPGQASNPGVARAPGGSEDAFAGGGSLAGAGGGGGGGGVAAAGVGRVQGVGGAWVGAGVRSTGMQYSPAQGGAGGGVMGVMTEEEYHRLVSSLGVGGGGGSLRERQVERQALGVARLSSPPSDARTASARYARDNVRVWRRNAVHGSQLLPPRYTTICVPVLAVHALPCQPIPLASTPCTLQCVVIIIIILFLFLLIHIINVIIIFIITSTSTSSIITLQPSVLSRKICCSTPSPLLQPLSAWSQGQIPLIHEVARAPFHPSTPDSSTPTYTAAATAAAVGRGSLGVGAIIVEGAGAGGAGLVQGGGGNLPQVMTEDEYQRLMSSWQPSLGLAATTSSTMWHGSSQNSSLLNSSLQSGSLAGQDGRAPLEVAAPLAQSVVLSECVCHCVCLCV